MLFSDIEAEQAHWEQVTMIWGRPCRDDRLATVQRGKTLLTHSHHQCLICINAQFCPCLSNHFRCAPMFSWLLYMGCKASINLTFNPECWLKVSVCVYFVICGWLRDVIRCDMAAQTFGLALCKNGAMWNQAALIRNESEYHGQSQWCHRDIITLTLGLHVLPKSISVLSQSCQMKHAHQVAIAFNL